MLCWRTYTKWQIKCSTPSPLLLALLCQVLDCCFPLLEQSQWIFHPTPIDRTEDFEEELYTPDDGILRGRLKNLLSLANLDVMLKHLPEPKRRELMILILLSTTLMWKMPSQSDNAFTWLLHSILFLSQRLRLNGLFPVKKPLSLSSLCCVLLLS